MDQYFQTVDKVTELLSENREWVKRYCDYTIAINCIIAENKKAGKMFGKSPNLDIYTSVSRTKNTTKDKASFDMRYNGQRVAMITVNINNRTIFLKPEKPNASTYMDYPDALDKIEPIEWTCGLAKQFRAYFASSPKMIKCKNIEHSLESQLIKQFSLSKSKGKHLVNIQPVKLLGKPFQMPTPLGACGAKTGKIEYSNGSGGGIDILTRHGKGRGTFLTVIELKDECKRSERPEIAIKQAIAYATFTRFLLRNNDAGAEDWWNFFGFTGSIPEQLKIKVVIAMPKGQYNDKSFADKPLIIKGSSDLLELHYIYFGVSEDGLTITDIADTSLRK